MLKIGDREEDDKKFLGKIPCKSSDFLNEAWIVY